VRAESSDAVTRTEFFAHVELLRRDEPMVTSEQIGAEACISTKRQAKYQQRMSSLLAGRE
jgi:hypothetical protein